MKNFSTIMAPIIEVIEGASFRWTPKAQLAVEKPKD